MNSPGGGPQKSVVSHDRVPSVTKLKPNFPNPFNPVTTIEYDLAQDVHVTLKVYDVLGREVTTLADEHQSAGYKSVQFDANTLPSGVYFYQLTAGSYFEMRKMLVMR